VDRSLFVDLSQRTRRVLDSLHNLALFSRGKFIEKEFGDFFFKVVTDDIQKVDILLNAILHYAAFNSPIVKKGTVNTLVEDAVKKHLMRLESKRIKLSRRLQGDLPETVVPDEQMRFMLETLIQYAIVLVPSGSGIELSTKSLQAPAVMEGVNLRADDGSRTVEVTMSFSAAEAAEQPARDFAVLSGKDEILDVLLRVVDSIAEMNHGKMVFDHDETATTSSISLRLPAERRRHVYYEPIVG
jgi:hypothetical protein